MIASVDIIIGGGRVLPGNRYAPHGEFFGLFVISPNADYVSVQYYMLQHEHSFGRKQYIHT